MTFEPIRKRITVPVLPAAAFGLFTDGMGEWWPMETHSCTGSPAATVRFEPGIGGRIVEVSPDGTEHVWGTLTAWEPGVRFACRWYPGHDEASATDLEILFAADGVGGTEISLAHSGWEARGEDAEAMRSAYGTGWDAVLARAPGAAAVSPAG